MKEFDSIRYGLVLDDFLMKLEQIPTYDSDEVQDVVEPLCQLLRVSKITVELYHGEENQRSAVGSNNTAYYDFEMTPDPVRKMQIREVTGGNSIIVYTAFQDREDEDWDRTELRRIEVMLKMLFVFNGRRRIMSIVEHMTFHDKYLDVYNTTYFMRRVGELQSNDELGRYSAGFFNLKNFGSINQAIGRDVATEVMEKYAKGLEKIVAPDGCVCRNGGDKFAVLFLKDKFTEVQYYLSGHEIIYDKASKRRVRVSAYVGYYLIPEQGADPKAVMNNIAVAADVAKMEKDSPYIIFDDALMERNKESRILESVFPDAIRQEEFLVYYQPKVDMKNYHLAGAEALCRWMHEGSLLAPIKYIPIFEKSNLICELDFYMLEHVCKDIRRWLDEGKEVVKISVNMSRRHLGNSDFLSQIITIVDRYHVPHGLIEIELTETTTDADFAMLRDVVYGLKDAGFRTAVDDFGIGYSSMNLIRDLPWNVIKLDKSFLWNENSMMKRNRSMLKHVISMVQEMGMECIVEGVETVEHVKLLKTYNCFMAQGYYFDRPLPRAEFEQRIEDYTRMVRS